MQLYYYISTKCRKYLQYTFFLLHITTLHNNTLHNSTLQCSNVIFWIRSQQQQQHHCVFAQPQHYLGVWERLWCTRSCAVRWSCAPRCLAQPIRSDWSCRKITDLITSAVRAEPPAAAAATCTLCLSLIKCISHVTRVSYRISNCYKAILWATIFIGL